MILSRAGMLLAALIALAVDLGGEFKGLGFVSASSLSSTSQSVQSRTKTKKATKSISASSSDATSEDSYNSNAFSLLAKAIRPLLTAQEQDSTEALASLSAKQVTQAFESLSRAQQTLKALDGISHEAYQRTHANSADQVDESVRGRARRSAARATATANALFACELCEFMQYQCHMSGNMRDDKSHEEDGGDLEDSSRPSLDDWKSELLEGRTVLYNGTHEAITLDNDNDITLNLLVLYESNYQGGVGLRHGAIDDDASSTQQQQHGGRLLVLLCDSAADDLSKTLRCLHRESMAVDLDTSNISGEIRRRTQQQEPVTHVHDLLYQAAGQALERIAPFLNQTSSSSSEQEASSNVAIHFVGRSLAGGVASIAATILDGGLPMPPTATATPLKNRRSKRDNQPLPTESHQYLSGYAHRRTSAVTLGAPPCLSTNVPTECITSVLYGDDIVGRTTKPSMDRFLKRVRKTCQRGNGGLMGRQLARMTDTLAMAATSLKKQQQASSSSSSALSVPGRAFLVRPRRLENHCSIHEVGQYMKQKREALRAAVLWQLNDVLLSKSLWKHHQLDSYIHGLDRVQLRGVGEAGDGMDVGDGADEDDEEAKKASMEDGIFEKKPGQVDNDDEDEESDDDEGDDDY